MTDFERGAEAAARIVESEAMNGPRGNIRGALKRAARRIRAFIAQQPPGSESREARLEKALRNAAVAIGWAIKDDYDFGGSLRSPTVMALHAANLEIRQLAPDARPEEKK